MPSGKRDGKKSLIYQLVSVSFRWMDKQQARGAEQVGWKFSIKSPQSWQRSCQYSQNITVLAGAKLLHLLTNKPTTSIFHHFCVTSIPASTVSVTNKQCFASDFLPVS